MRPPSSRQALVRRPSPLLASGVVEMIERVQLDYDVAVQQWTSYVDTLHSSGWDVIEVAPADECPDGVYVEDTAVVEGNLAMLTRSGAPTRRPELTGVRRALESCGYHLTDVHAPGTLDGGDVLVMGSQVWVGVGARTNLHAAAQVERLFSPRGCTVTPVPLTKATHLKDAVSALPDGSVLGYPPSLDDPSLFDQFWPVPEPSGAHLVPLDAHRVLVATSAPRTADLLVSLGYEPVTVNISEFEKREGTVCCLSLRLHPPTGNGAEG